MDSFSRFKQVNDIVLTPLRGNGVLSRCVDTKKIENPHAYTLASLHHVKDLTQGICQHHDHAAALASFVQFAVRAYEPDLPVARDMDR